MKVIYCLLPSSCPFTATMQYSSSPTDEGSDVGAIVGGVVAGLAVTVIVVALMVVIVVMCVTRKHGKVQVSEQINPFYVEGE